MRRRICMVLLAATVSAAAWAGPLIIDHEDVDITLLTEAQINRAKSVLHIGYGHTSHGSQVTDGMNGLVAFANGGGKGLDLPDDIFAWNNGGVGGALDLEEGAGYGSGWLELDGGYWPTWYDETIEYLDDPSHADVNVVIWSWCGQMDDKYSSGTLSSQYLTPMSNLETSYPDVVFVYMTGHAEIGDDADNKAACAAIRDYCIRNDKVLFDFNDIEHYDPDGTYFPFVHDNCNYYDSAGGSQLGNWAEEWQDTHDLGTDWYSCGAAHTRPLNANQKAYAVWALWCALAADLDRDGIDDEWEERHGGTDRFNGGDSDFDGDGVTDTDEFRADTDPADSASLFQIDSITTEASCSVRFLGSADRIYGLEATGDLFAGTWDPVTGQTGVPGPGGEMTLIDTAPAARRYYRVTAGLP